MAAPVAAARYAIYFAPAPETALWRFGSAAIGYDAATGADQPIPEVAGFSPERLREITAEPRRYGFHATLKPPFRLADPTDAAGLLEAVARVAASCRPFGLPELRLDAIGGFLALTVAGRPQSLHDLADTCVERFDPWRAAMDEAEMARRASAGLSERERDHLARWGYPYVFDRFRFHMTLTGRLADAERAALASALSDRFAAIAAPVAVDALTVFVQPDPAARFRVLARFPFG
ncbi:DUF1045 domain-containing protein [Prosthecodimorpha staleyi]|uniref:DUF1045 domain-containing protein n=1 Tax=Prosthecodimorpha staleyi TaxID=2840188 RepID=A0A947D2X6_9HYPH|nr:DUF1045 domain-containing protein [Prosthecodimorpha staleyi]MBT9289780.1 DUF1045 domain-containing protein [Prosthecodimorpha staleyi]